MINPESSLNPFPKVRGTKPWILDRIVHPPSRHSLQLKGPPLIPRFLPRWVIVQIPLLLLGTCMLLFLWETNSFGAGLATGNSNITCTTSSTPAAPQTGIEPTPRVSLAPSTVATRVNTPLASQPKPTAARIPDGTASKYEVKSGDSLWVIATTHGVSVDELRAANGLTSNLLHVGDQLIIPPKTR